MLPLLLVIALSQSSAPSEATQLRARLRQTSSLTTQDLTRLVAVVRAASAGKTVRVSAGANRPYGPPSIQLDALGRIGWVNEGGVVRHYTYRPAEFCGGGQSGPAGGDLVEQYAQQAGGWVTAAVVANPIEPTPRLFDVLTGSQLTDAGTRIMDGAVLRGIQMPWKAPRFNTEGPDIPDTVQTLWIDVETLLPRRYEIAVNVAGIGDYGYVMELSDGPDLRPPSSIKAPGCIDPRNRGGIIPGTGIQ
jgi:hypothetical protein